MTNLGLCRTPGKKLSHEMFQFIHHTGAAMDWKVMEKVYTRVVVSMILAIVAAGVPFALSVILYF